MLVSYQVGDTVLIGKKKAEDKMREHISDVLGEDPDDADVNIIDENFVAITVNTEIHINVE